MVVPGKIRKRPVSALNQCKELGMVFLTQLVISGFSLGMIYTLIAIGFVLILKCSNAFNIAQGQFVLIGGYLGYTFLVPLHLPIWAS